MKETFSILKITYQNNKVLFTLYLLFSIFIYFSSYLNIYLFKEILDILIKNSNKKLENIIIILVVIVLINNIIIFFNKKIIMKIKYNMNLYYEKNYLNKLLNVKFKYIESNEWQQVLHIFKNSINRVINYPLNILYQLMGLFMYIYYSYKMIQFNLIGGILFIVLMVPCAIICSKLNSVYWNRYQEMIPDNRKMAYYRWMLTDGTPIRDMKIYNAYGYITKRYFDEKNEYFKKKIKADKYELTMSSIMNGIPVIPAVIMLIFIIYSGFANKLVVSEMQLYASITLMMYSYTLSTTKILFGDNKIFKYCYNNIYEFMNYESEETNEGIKLEILENIEFKNVFFKYPNSDELVLNGISFMIKKGEVISLIGINGAGKSTIIKLMLGFYTPYKGNILINGIDISKYDIKSLRNNIGVLFQSFGKYSLTLRESVGLSKINKMKDKDKIENSIINVGLDNVFDLKNLDINISRQFDDNGRELSGGEWQKLALARIDFKDSPMIILDEPSSALDAEAEDELFEKYSSMANNKTVLLISHRIFVGKLSSKIILIKNGIVIEQGTHEELMTKKGEYYEYYNFQLNRFGGNQI